MVGGLQETGFCQRLEQMRLLVGLGNPGKKYAGTRHNVGFVCLDKVVERHGGGAWREKFHGEINEVSIGDQRVVLLRPLAYMNRSGRSVRAARDFFKLENNCLLVVCDDINLPLARLRFRAKGSAGGQKGLGDVIRNLETDEFSRLRVGVGLPPEAWDSADYVLSRFRADETSSIDEALDRCGKAIGDWVVHDIQYCMNHYNADHE